ncbi:unnamed protein product [Ilex paraguariensis]|uniref:Uncharacterized protein n=1 Tax=Ilex paraguariensis TaxID=185542 RepID=A0ABC8U0P7_9AQUA
MKKTANASMAMPPFFQINDSCECLVMLFQVEKLARGSFFFLRESFPFDESSFGELSDGITTKKPMLTSKPISYVFELCPPTEIQLSDYTTVLRQCLHDIQ